MSVPVLNRVPHQTVDTRSREREKNPSQYYLRFDDKEITNIQVNLKEKSSVNITKLSKVNLVFRQVPKTNTKFFKTPWSSIRGKSNDFIKHERGGWKIFGQKVLQTYLIRKV